MIGECCVPRLSNGQGSTDARKAPVRPKATMDLPFWTHAAGTPRGAKRVSVFVGCPKEEISRKNGREEKAFTVVLVGFLKTGVRPEGEEDVGRQEAADIPKQAGGFVFLTFSLFRRPYFLLRVRIRSCLYGFVKGRTKSVEYAPHNCSLPFRPAGLTCRSGAGRPSFL